jgi:6,7-dimethyl-8-ribityllumazine synthase
MSGAFAIVASQYNARYVDAMLQAAKAELRRAGQTRVQVIRVPGAFEIPVVAARLAASAHASRITPATLSAIICFGVIFQGQTSHAQHIGWGVTHALAQIQIHHQVPVIHAVFVFEKEEHARVRCLGKKHNRGTEAARTALAMAEVMREMESE